LCCCLQLQNHGNGLFEPGVSQIMARLRLCKLCAPSSHQRSPQASRIQPAALADTVLEAAQMPPHEAARSGSRIVLAALCGAIRHNKVDGVCGNGGVLGGSDTGL
jgi:hypothetical protein